MNRSVLNISLCFTMTCSCSISKADKIRAEAFFNQATSEFDHRNFAAACPYFEKSFHLDQNLGTLLSLADCLDRQGKTASALMRYREFATEYSKLDEATRRARRSSHRDALNSIQMLEHRVPHLHLKMPDPVPKGLTVSLDGVALAASTIESERELDPGPHQLVMKVPGNADVTCNMLIIERQRLFVPIANYLPSKRKAHEKLHFEASVLQFNSPGPFMAR